MNTFISEVNETSFIKYWNDTLPSKLVSSKKFNDNLALLISKIIFRDSFFADELSKNLQLALNEVASCRVLDSFDSFDSINITTFKSHRLGLIPENMNIFVLEDPDDTEDRFGVCYTYEIDVDSLSETREKYIDRHKRALDYTVNDELEMDIILFRGNDEDCYFERDNDLILECRVSDDIELCWSPYGPDNLDDVIWGNLDVDILIPAIRINLSELVRRVYNLPPFANITHCEDLSSVRNDMRLYHNCIIDDSEIRMDNFVECCKIGVY